MGFDNVTTLSGLFYISSTKDEKCGYLETVLSWKQFWGNSLQQPSFTPFSYNSNNVFEYLEVLLSVFLTIDHESITKSIIADVRDERSDIL